jgi:hypothetical protein
MREERELFGDDEDNLAALRSSPHSVDWIARWKDDQEHRYYRQHLLHFHPLPSSSTPPPHLPPISPEFPALLSQSEDVGRRSQPREQRDAAVCPFSRPFSPLSPSFSPLSSPRRPLLRHLHPSRSRTPSSSASTCRSAAWTYGKFPLRRLTTVSPTNILSRRESRRFLLAFCSLLSLHDCLSREYCHRPKGKEREGEGEGRSLREEGNNNTTLNMNKTEKRAAAPTCPVPPLRAVLILRAAAVLPLHRWFDRSCRRIGDDGRGANGEERDGEVNGKRG